MKNSLVFFVLFVVFFVGCSMEEELTFIKYRVYTEQPVQVTFRDFGEVDSIITVTDSWEYISWGNKYDLNFAHIEVYYDDVIYNRVSFSIFVKEGFCPSEGEEGFLIDEDLTSPIPR